MMDLDDFERTIRAATPGVRSFEPVNRDEGQDEGYIVTAPDLTCIANYVERHEDALLLAECTPERLLALVRVARATQAWVNCAPHHETLTDAIRDLDAL